MRYGNLVQSDCSDGGAVADPMAERVVKSLDTQAALAVSVLCEPLTEHVRQPFASQRRHHAGVARGRDPENDMPGVLGPPWQFEAKSRRKEVGLDGTRSSSTLEAHDFSSPGAHRGSSRGVGRQSGIGGLGPIWFRIEVRSVHFPQRLAIKFPG